MGSVVIRCGHFKNDGARSSPRQLTRGSSVVKIHCRRKTVEAIGTAKLGAEEECAVARVRRVDRSDAAIGVLFFGSISV